MGPPLTINPEEQLTRFITKKRYKLKTEEDVINPEIWLPYPPGRQRNTSVFRTSNWTLDCIVNKGRVLAEECYQKELERWHGTSELNGKPGAKTHYGAVKLNKASQVPAPLTIVPTEEPLYHAELHGWATETEFDDPNDIHHAQKLVKASVFSCPADPQPTPSRAWTPGFPPLV